MEEIELDKKEDYAIASEIYLTLIQSNGHVANVSLERPDGIHLFSDEEWLNGLEASHGQFIEFEFNQGFVILGVARILCIRVGLGNARFAVYPFEESRKCGCYS